MSHQGLVAASTNPSSRILIAMYVFPNTATRGQQDIAPKTTNITYTIILCIIQIEIFVHSQQQNDDTISFLKAIFIQFIGSTHLSLWPSYYADDSTRYWEKYIRGISLFIFMSKKVSIAWFSARKLLNVWCDTWTIGLSTENVQFLLFDASSCASSNRFK